MISSRLHRSPSKGGESSPSCVSGITRGTIPIWKGNVPAAPHHTFISTTLLHHHGRLHDNTHQHQRLLLPKISYRPLQLLTCSNPSAASLHEELLLTHAATWSTPSQPVLARQIIHMAATLGSLPPTHLSGWQVRAVKVLTDLEVGTYLGRRGNYYFDAATWRSDKTSVSMTRLRCWVWHS